MHMQIVLGVVHPTQLLPTVTLCWLNKKSERKTLSIIDRRHTARNPPTREACAREEAIRVRGSPAVLTTSHCLTLSSGVTKAGHRLPISAPNSSRRYACTDRGPGTPGDGRSHRSSIAHPDSVHVHCRAGHPTLPVSILVLSISSRARERNVNECAEPVVRNGTSSTHTWDHGTNENLSGGSPGQERIDEEVCDLHADTRSDRVDLECRRIRCNTWPSSGKYRSPAHQ
ncbi:hypothetical protein EVAR_83466_1 [Eumeta japonica]|uniref:Uncharacterized protein n=1 Tax=Eumeta variegata TaxID=151549 RepID=A0A4C1TYJ8_EUMVA|nr:hypothetical protein EVAR_83466_1 [Eumeta japonica]